MLSGDMYDMGGDGGQASEFATQGSADYWFIQIKAKKEVMEIPAYSPAVALSDDDDGAGMHTANDQLPSICVY